MPVTDREIATLAASHDIITIGMRADDARRERHGTRTTFVRVADVPADVAAPLAWPPAAGEIRIVGVPASRAAAIERVRAGRGRGQRRARLRLLARRPRAARRARAGHAAGAARGTARGGPRARRRGAVRSSAGSAPVDRGGEHLRPHARAAHRPSAAVRGRPCRCYKRVAELQRDVGVIRAFAPLPRAINPAVPTTGYDDVKRVALARAGRRQRAVDSGGLVALRSEARAGRAHGRRRRRGRRVGGRRRRPRGAAARRSRRFAATSARRVRSRSSATAASTSLAR